MRRARPGMTAIALAGAAVLGLLPGWSSAPADAGTAAGSPRGAAVAQGPAPGPAPAVLPATVVVGATAPTPTTAGLRAALGDLLSDDALGPAVSAVVADPATDTVLLDRAGDRARTPASTLKILTALAALDALGTQARLVTRVVAGGAPDRITLVGAGDATLVSAPSEPGDPLAPASLATLAERTGRALEAAGRDRVSLRYDASLFTGPELAQGWPSSYPALGIVAPVTALMVDGGRADPAGVTRVSDPARAAAERFAALLADQGIEVAGVESGTAVPGAAVLARVASPTVADLVETMLTESDNDLAEALAHLAGGARAGSASFEGGATATLDTLGGLGLPTAGVRLVDGSGLSRDDAVPAVVLARALGQVARQEPSDSWPVSPGLPVAGVTGTLSDRFRSTATRAGAGVVRAKTGTLTGVVTLSGAIRDADGRVLTFAFLADEAPSLIGAREVLDRAATRLAGCGCG